MSSTVILTGLRANNDLHLGNYLGALLPIVEMQKKYSQQGDNRIHLFIPDLHSFTTPIDHSKLNKQIIHNLKLFVAAGLDLDDDNTHIYRQSYVPAHSELTVILNCFTYMGELKRMTQFKEKSEAQDSGSVGLFDYPVLMASDILLYGAKYVPVGADQTQHVELARDIGIRFNHKFNSEIFKVPEAEKAQIEFMKQHQRLRIKDLIKPEKKMSKSDDTGKGVIFLGDDPNTVTKKIMSATTDSLSKISYDHNSQPGISNLLEIYSALSDKSINELCEQYKNETSYNKFKSDLATIVSNFIAEFQNKMSTVDMPKINAKLKDSEEKMNKVANETLAQVQKVVGLRA